MKNNCNITPVNGNEDENESMLNILEKMSRDFSNVKVTTDEEAGRATLYGERGGRRYSIDFDRSEIGENRTFSEYQSFDRKSDYKDEVIRLYRQGHKQKTIALRLGISQSLVSKLLNE